MQVLRDTAEPMSAPGRGGLRAAAMPIAATLFGLSEFGEGWVWLPYAQGGLLGFTFLLAPASFVAQGSRSRIATSIVGAAVLLIASWTTHSTAWALLAGLLLLRHTPFGRSRASEFGFFVGAATAVLGAGCVYLHGPVLWSGNWVSGPLLRVFPEKLVSVMDEWAVVKGQRIHLSAFSPLTGVLAIAAVLARYELRRMRAVVVGFCGLIAAVLFRVGLVLGFVGTEQPLWMVHPLFTALFVSLVGGVTAYLAGTAAGPASPRPRPLCLGAAVLAGAALWAALGPEAERPTRRLRVIIDDAHGEWETTGRAYGMERYGRDTVYTYTLLRQWLSRHEVEATTARPIRPRGDVLIVKTPALPFSDEEQAAIQRFVSDGGGLLAIGDHTNLFGMTDNLNVLIAPTGLALRADAAIPFAGVTRTFRPAWWNAGPLVPLGVAWEVQTSATVVARNWKSRPLLVDTGILGEAAEYSNERNFGDLRPSPDDRRPPLVVAATAPWGRGRLVLLADSTPWSNFSFFAPPNKEVLDAAIRLAATSPQATRRAWAATLALAALASAVLLRAPLLLATGWALGVYALLSALTVAEGRHFAPTPADTDRKAKILIVDAETGPVSWNTDIRTDGARDRDVFSAFLAWTSRFGAEPEVRSSEAYANADHPVVILNPSREVRPTTLAVMEAYVREGGRILLLDDPIQRPHSTAARLLEPFGIRYQFEVTESRVHAAQGPRLPSLVWALPLALLQEGRREPGAVLAERAGLEVALGGVTPAWVDEQGLVIYGTKKIGKGRVHVFTRSSVFSQVVMGDVWGSVEPGRAKEQIYALEYQLLKDLFEEDKSSDPLKDVARRP